MPHGTEVWITIIMAVGAQKFTLLIGEFPTDGKVVITNVGHHQAAEHLPMRDYDPNMPPPGVRIANVVTTTSSFSGFIVVTATASRGPNN